MDAQRLINLAGFDLGELESGGSFNTDESNDALDILNQLLSNLSLEELFCYNRRHYVLALGANANAVTIGPAGSWATVARPVKVEGATAYYLNWRQGLEVISMAEFARRSTAPKAQTQPLPELLGVDNAATTLNARVFPVSSIGCNVELHTLEPLTAIATLATVLDFPPGYERPLRLILAGELYPQYARSAGMDPQLKENIANAKATLAQLNAAVVGIQPPPAQ